MTINDILNNGKTARQNVEEAITRVEADDSNAILEIIRERALERADEIDAKIAAVIARSEATKQSSKSDSGSPRSARDDIAKEVGRLAGVPFVAKDNFLTFGSKTTAAAKMLENFEAPLQATAIERLENEGAICIGKANLDAFAHGGSTENSAFGVTKNAHDKTRVAGGSSGGSAVAVARGIVPFALGSDTGGSIRQPSSFNGVVGYKPTYGMISRYGVVAMASSTDVVGPIASSVEDIILLCEIMAGQDGKDGTVLPNYFSIRYSELVPESKLPFDIIKDEKYDYSVDDDSPKIRKRTAVRVVLLNENDQVGLIYAKNGNYYKLPGGGVDEGETYEQAVVRETIEETGFESEIIGKFGYTKEYYSKSDKFKYAQKIDGMIGFSHCYVARTKKFVGLNLMEDEKSDGFEVKWVEAQKAIELLENAKYVETEMTGYDLIKIIERRDAIILKKYLEKIDWILGQAQNDERPKKLKIGLINEFMGEGVDESVENQINQYVTKLTEAGHAVSNVDLPMVKYSLPIYYIVVPAEISSNLARYDGIRYGERADAKTLADVYGESRDAGFVDENKRRIMIGSYVLSSGFFDAYYLQAQKARTLLINEFNKLFEEYDFLIGPVAPTPAFKIGENIDDPIKMYLSDIMTVPASLAGLPAISVPAGTDENGLPIGVQIIGPMRSDRRLLEFVKGLK